MIHEPAQALDVRLLTAVLGAFPNGSINVFDRDLRYVYAAGQGLAEVGLSPKDLVDRTLDQLFEAPHIAIVKPHYLRGLDGEAGEFEFSVFGRTYFMAVAPIVTASVVTHIVVVTQDITARKAREVAVRDNEERLIAAESTLRALDRQKDAFISTLAHELRQPLGAMAAAVDVIKLRHPEVAPTTPMEILTRQLAHVRRLLDDLVDASHLSRGVVALVRERLDVRQVVQSALETVMPSAVERDQHAIVTLAETPLVLDGDRTRLQQVFSNLVNNASKFGRAGGHIAVVAAREDDQIVVRVRDDGIGMTPEMLPHVFEVFTQASPQDGGGIGVGLSVVHRLVAAHGGTVEAHSAGAGHGSEFVVRLPAIASDAGSISASRQAEAARQAQPESELHGPTEPGGSAGRACLRRFP